jgi:uncharacterized membrane protein YgaE (UPF0421/DUF939 family)
MYSAFSRFATTMHFMLVLLVTVLAWLGTGKLVQLLFPDLPTLGFLLVGLGAGFLLALVLPPIYQEPEGVTAHPQDGLIS